MIVTYMFPLKHNYKITMTKGQLTLSSRNFTELPKSPTIIFKVLYLNRVLSFSSPEGIVLITVFRRHLDGQAKRSEITLLKLYGNPIANNFF